MISIISNKYVKLNIKNFASYLLFPKNEVHYIGGAEILPPPLSADEETEMIIVNVYDVKTNTLKRKVELTKLKLMQLIKRYEKTDPDKITWYDRTLLEWGDSDKKKR